MSTTSSEESFVYPHHFDILGRSHISFFPNDPRYVAYRERWERNPRDEIVSDFPLHLDIELSGRCNLMCSHCLRHSRRINIGDMEVETFKKIIDEGEKYGLCAIDLDWLGESFLHPQLISMGEYAKSKGILDVMISTNGTLIDKDMSKRLLDSGSLDTIVFSLDAVTESTYDRLKVGSSFKLVNGHIEYLINSKEKRGLKKPKIIVQMIDQKQSHEELMSFIHYWRSRADGVRISTYLSPDGKPNDKRRAQNTPKTIFPCPKLWQRLTIAWDGTVYPCIGDNACRSPLGNVKETNIYDLWHGDVLKDLREKHKRFKADDVEICRHCDLNKVPKAIDNYQRELTKGD